MQTNYTKLVEIYALRVSKNNKTHKKVTEKFFNIEKKKKKKTRELADLSTFINQFNFLPLGMRARRPVLGSFRTHWRPASDR